MGTTRIFKMPASVFQPYRVSQVGGRISPWKEEEKIEELNDSIETCSLSSNDSSLTSDESSLTSDVSEQIKSESTDKYWPRRKKSVLIDGVEIWLLFLKIRLRREVYF